MSNERKPGDEPIADASDSEAILSRRNFLIKAALAGVGIAGIGASCEETNEPQPRVCLTPEPFDTADDDQPQDVFNEDLAQPCLSPLEDTEEVDVIDEDQPQPCLSPPLEDIVDEDQPQPCLTPLLDTSDDVIDEDQPQICLSPPLDDTID